MVVHTGPTVGTVILCCPTKIGANNDIELIVMPRRPAVLSKEVHQIKLNSRTLERIVEQVGIPTPSSNSTMQRALL